MSLAKSAFKLRSKRSGVFDMPVWPTGTSHLLETELERARKAGVFDKPIQYLKPWFPLRRRRPPSPDMATMIDDLERAGLRRRYPLFIGLDLASPGSDRTAYYPQKFGRMLRSAPTGNGKLLLWNEMRARFTK